jgi:hypothetical protein
MPRTVWSLIGEILSAPLGPIFLELGLCIDLPFTGETVPAGTIDGESILAGADCTKTSSQSFSHLYLPSPSAHY